MRVCLCMCVYVCVKEREREREGESVCVCAYETSVKQIRKIEDISLAQGFSVYLTFGILLLSIAYLL